MEFLRDKYFFWGVLAGLLWASFGVIMLIFTLSDTSIEASFYSLYQQQKLGGLISLGAMINLPIFFIAIRKNKFAFAAGLVAISLVLVLLIAILKLNF
ncbi:hypothetical protein OAP80_03370 [Flavobacteriaceae bacterium]|nr:hypothetical protein [Flavobacteriaceae bacterium]MDA9851304.1 hypothetical protein [Flavobacteriaceae bacterium]MDC0872424.1 hypothetical protein [Flavobacteriaceae bacterium]